MQAQSYRFAQSAEVGLERQVKIVRLKLGMSQSAFAEAFGLPLRTLQEWEQGHVEPQGAIRSYRRVIGRDPEAVIRAFV